MQLSIASGGTLSIDDGSIAGSSYTNRTFNKAVNNFGTVNFPSSRLTYVTANGAITNKASGTFNITTTGARLC